MWWPYGRESGRVWWWASQCVKARQLSEVPEVWATRGDSWTGTHTHTHAHGPLPPPPSPSGTRAGWPPAAAAAAWACTPPPPPCGPAPAAGCVWGVCGVCVGGGTGVRSRKRVGACVRQHKARKYATGHTVTKKHPSSVMFVTRVSPPQLLLHLPAHCHHTHLQAALCVARQHAAAAQQVALRLELGGGTLADGADL